MRNMYDNIHTRFILSPILNILYDTKNACMGIGNGIGTQSLGEYVLQTTFLKMTGASEQKLKCICWELATNDYEYRYQYLKKNYGECSAYTDKSSIYKDLINAVTKLNPAFNVNDIFEDIDISPMLGELIQQKINQARKNQERNKKKRKLTDTEYERLSKGMTLYYSTRGFCKEEMANFRRIVLFRGVQNMIHEAIGNSLISQWEQHNYANYMKLWNALSSTAYAEGDTLLGKELQDFYTDIVYTHRNRCAHNLKSFQNNLPTLKTLASENYVYDNYYFYFSILILLDEIFIRLYKTYIETYNSNRVA